jgi:hypothetical protein
VSEPIDILAIAAKNYALCEETWRFIGILNASPTTKRMREIARIDADLWARDLAAAKQLAMDLAECS